MKLRSLIFLLPVSLLLPFGSSAQTEDSPDGDSSFLIQDIPRSWGFYLHTDQDAFQNTFNEDRNYTMGVSIGVFGDFADRDKLGLPWLRRKVDRWLGFDSLHTQNLIHSPALFLNGNGFTPLDIASVEPVRNDRSFASLLAIGSSLTSAREPEGAPHWALTTELSFGVLGLNVAKNAQSYIHEHHWLGSVRPIPLGWHNQISNGGEPTLLYRVTHRRLLFENNYFNARRNLLMHRLQVMGLLEGMVGYYTNAAAGIEARLGFFSNPFWDIQTNMGSGMNEDPEIKRKLHGFEMFVYGSLRSRLVGYNALMQGQFRKSAHTLSATQIERMIGEYELGLGITLWRVQVLWGIIAGRSPEYRGEMARPHVWGAAQLRYNFKYTQKKKISLR